MLCFAASKFFGVSRYPKPPSIWMSDCSMYGKIWAKVPTCVSFG